MVEIDVTCHLEAFRRFLVNSTCRSFIPESYMRDPEVFPEKESEPGSIYIEAADKVTLKRIRDITFVNANEVLGIIYTSKSGNSKLKWRQMTGPTGRVTGEASQHSLVNLSMSRVLSPEYIEEIMSRQPQASAAEEIAEVKAEEAAEARPPPPGPQAIPLDEEEDDFEAADADVEEQEELEEQEREEAV